jgi:hypothetical protein
MNNDEKISKIYDLLQGISSDVNDIKDHLGLETVLRTADQRFIYLKQCINNMIVLGQSVDEIKKEIFEDTYQMDFLAICDENDKEKIMEMLTEYIIETIEKYKQSPESLKKNKKTALNNLKRIAKNI